MNLKSRHKIDPAFNMSSMTDIVFLLLIFFMLTSSFVSQNIMPVNLPTSSQSRMELKSVTLTVTKELKYFVNEKQVPFEQLKSTLQDALKSEDFKDNVIVVNADEAITHGEAIKVAGLAAELNAKVSFATERKGQ